jgi:hypothetical protein
MTAIVVVPVMLAVDGLWGGRLADGKDADPPLGSEISLNALSAVVLPAIVTALHVRVVESLARGEHPSVGGAMAAAAPRLWPACLAVALYIVVLSAGLIALVVPGIWLMVRFYFAAQVAVVDGLGPRAALSRSAELVDGRWWRVAGISAVLWLLSFALGGVLGLAVEFTDNGPLYVAGELVGATIALSIAALGGTLLFFDLRARREPGGRRVRTDFLPPAPG